MRNTRKIKPFPPLAAHVAGTSCAAGNHRRKMRNSEQPSHPQIGSSFANTRRREDEKHTNDLRSWREGDSRSGEEEGKEKGEGKEREHATREMEGGVRFVDKEGSRPCLVDGNKGDFGYLKPKLAIVYSF